MLRSSRVSLRFPDNLHAGHAFGVRADRRVTRGRSRAGGTRPIRASRPHCGQTADPAIRGRGAGRGVGKVISCSISVTCSAGTPISITSIPSLACSTRWRISGGWIKQSPAVRRIGGALILIDHIDPALDAEDQLKPDLVEMHHVRHRAAVRNADMAGDDRAAKTRRDKIAVVHARAADDPRRLIGQAAHDKGVFGRRLDQRRVKLLDRHAGAARCGQLARTTSNRTGSSARMPMARRGVVRLQPHAQPVAGESPPPPGCRREKSFKPHPQRFGEKWQINAQSWWTARASARMLLRPGIFCMSCPSIRPHRRVPFAKPILSKTTCSVKPLAVQQERRLAPAR